MSTRARNVLLVVYVVTVLGPLLWFYGQAGKDVTLATVACAVGICLLVGLFVFHAIAGARR